MRWATVRLVALVVTLPALGIAEAGDAKPTRDVGVDDVNFSDPARRSHVDVETTAAVVMGTEKAAGRCFIESGQSLLCRSLSPAGAIGALEPVTLPPLGSLESSLAIDNMLVHLRSGELLLIRQSQTTEPVTSPPAAAKAFVEWRDYIGGRRAVQAMWRSSDRGTRWTRLPNLDAALVLEGACGWPQEVNGKPWVGGWDRPEAYVDPATGTVFLTMGCVAGSPPQFRSHYLDQEILFVSRDDGESWTPTARFARWEPIAMTTTAGGRLFLAHAVGMDATSLKCHVYWMDPPWTKIGGEADAFYGDPAKSSNRCIQLPSERVVPRVGQPNVIPLTLSRVKARKGEHVVRLAFPAVDAGRQVERVVVVRVGATGPIEVDPGPTFSAADPKGSVLQAVFVETDGADGDVGSDAALLYWMEGMPVTGQMTARGALVTGRDGWSPAFDLARSAGERRSWTPHEEWLGDYMKGAFGHDRDRLWFLAQWPESSPPNIDLHANVVSLPRSPGR